MLRFHDVQELGNAGDDAVMVARGPFDAAEEQVIEICVWVFQRGDNDAAATEMTTGDHHHPGDDRRLRQGQQGPRPLEHGAASGGHRSPSRPATPLGSRSRC